MPKTRHGVEIEIPPETIAHLEAHLDVLAVLDEAISLLDVAPLTEGAHEVDLGRCIGSDRRASAPRVGLDEVTTFLRRPGRIGGTRVIEASAAPETSWVSLIIGLEPDTGRFFLVSAWPGRPSEKEPWDPTLDEAGFEKALTFWSENALLVEPCHPGVYRSTFRREIGEAHRHLIAAGNTPLFMPGPR